MQEVTPLRSYDMDDAAERLDELERLKAPTLYARGALTAVLLSRLTPEDKARAEALRTKWGKQ
jgi:hypothetical protein